MNNRLFVLEKLSTSFRQYLKKIYDSLGLETCQLVTTVG